MENEITVLVTCNLNTLKKHLKYHKFKATKSFKMNDIYMINKDTDLRKLSTLEILSKCVIIRDIPNSTKELLYKIKEYAPNGDIISQSKISCNVEDLKKAKIFMEAINYKMLFQIKSNCIVYSNKESELLVQVVNNDYILIEKEEQKGHEKNNHKGIELLKEELNKYNLPIDKTNYFVKKAEIELKKMLKL